MNGFNDQDQNVSIAAMLIQSMFPPINVAKTNISNIKRAVFINNLGFI